MRHLITILTALVALASATTAQAQIYSWRDANGHLVLSDRPLGDGARSFAVTTASTIRTTTRVTVPTRYSYDDLIERHAAAHHVRPDLVRAVIQVESGFNRYATSPKGAMGLMQLMPATAARLGVRDAYDPAENIRGGVAYLRQLLDRYSQNEELALAAYNAGPIAVEKHGTTIPPYRETRNYVKKIKGITDVSAQARKRVIYKTVEVVDGREVPRYSDTKPASGPYEVVSLTR
ncbi:MAG TPA: lytic transglycosylase domain-containing protein [Vicinamibacterales bacterium]